MPRTIECLLYK